MTSHSAALAARLDVPTRLPDTAPPGLSRALLERGERSFTAAVCKGFEVREIWRGHGTASHNYQTFDAEALAPKLDDVGFRGTDFGICRGGPLLWRWNGGVVCVLPHVGMSSMR